MATKNNEATEVLAKEIKTQLKQARDLINQKDHNGALKICEAVIKKDKNCYMAWIMIAACAQELKQFNQAQNALYKAIELDDNQLLAYQGIIQLGERAPNFLNPGDISSSLRKLCTLTRTTDAKKFFDFAKKNIEFLKKQIVPSATTMVADSYDPYRIQIGELCRDILEEKSLELSQEDQRHYRLTSIDFLSKVQTLSIQMNEFLSSNYFWLSQSSSDNDERLNYYEKYIRCLCQMKNSSSDIIDYCNECLNLFPNSSIAQDTIIRIVLETLFPQIYDPLAPVAKLNDALARVRSTGDSRLSSSLISAKSFFMIRNGKYSNSLELLLTADENDDCRHLVSILKTVSYTNLHLIKPTIEMINSTRTELGSIIVKDSIPSIESLLDLCLASITYDQGRYEKSIEYFEKVLQKPNKFHIRAGQGRFNALCSLNNSIEARASYEQIRDRLEAHEEFSCRLQLISVEEHPIELLKLVQAASKEAEDNEQSLELTVHGWLSLAHAHLEIQRSNDMFDRQICKKAFETAIKLDSYFWPNYAGFSQYYEEIEQNLSEALIYSKAAFQLNENIESVQMKYVDHLLKAEQIDEAVNVLEQILALDPMKTWAHFRLGLVRIRMKNIHDAVKTLQIVSRRGPVAGATWSALGDAHLHSNNLKSALSCYSKASALESETLYSATREGLTLTLLGRFTEAIQRFDKVLNQSPKYLLARKGKGEAYLYLAMQQIGSYKDQWAVDSVQIALKAFHDALFLQSNYACLWKKYGDACMLLHGVNDKLINIRLPPLSIKQDDNKIKDVDGCITLKKDQLLQRAQSCFMQAIRLKPRSSAYWSSLAQCMYIQARLKSNDLALLNLALEYMKVAITLKPTDHLLWNSLGVITAHPILNESGLAQHCFLKSLKLQRSAMAYTNLGLIYYRHHNLDMANKAFSNAQQTDPTYSLAWLGQALIAEMIEYDECIDLYRHTVELSNHSQGLYGYGKVIAHLLTDPNKKFTDAYKYSVTYLTGNQRAADALMKYIQRNPSDTDALQCLGIIHEFNRRFIQATEAYQLSLSQLDPQTDLFKRVKNDYARALCRSGNPKAEAFFVQDTSMSLLDVLWLAIAHAKINERLKSIEILKRYIDDTKTTNQDRSILLTFLALYQRDIDPQMAVKNLFKSYSTKPTCSNAVTALCTMGMIIGDSRISSAALKEMPKLGDPNYNMDSHLLNCLSMFTANKISELNIYAMNGVIHYPWLSTTWIFACIARIQMGQRSGLLEMVERICHSHLFTLDQRMVIVLANILNRILSERNERILQLFQMLILHFPALLDLRIAFAQYIQSFDAKFGQSLACQV